MEAHQCQHCSIRARSISASRAAKPGCRCSCAICRRPTARRRNASCCMCMARRSPPRCPLRTASMAVRGATNCAPRASCLGSGFSWLRPFGSVSRHVGAAGRTRSALHRGGCQPAVGTGCAVHLSASRDRAGFHHRAFLGHDRRRPPRGTLSWPDRSARAVRCHREAQRQCGAGLPGMASGFATGPMAALHRGGAVRRITCVVAPTFR